MVIVIGIRDAAGLAWSCTGNWQQILLSWTDLHSRLYVPLRGQPTYTLFLPSRILQLFH